MSDTTTIDVRLTPPEFDRAEQVIERLQQHYPQMSIDDAIDFIFRVGVLHLCDQDVLALDADDGAPFGQVGQHVVAVLT